MRVCRTQDVRPRCVDGPVDQEGRLVQHFDLAVVQDVALVIDAKQIALVDAVEVDAKRIDPETVLLYGVSNSDVAGKSFVKRVVTEDAVSTGELSLDILALLVFVAELEFGR